MNKSISMVMPFYNEIEYMGITVTKAKDILDFMNVDYEIILVNDASFDGSEIKALELSESDLRIKLFHHKKNSGLGAALKTGFKNSCKDIIIYTDLDMPFDFSILPDAVALLENADIVQGYRTGKRESFLRMIYSKSYNFLIRSIFKYETNDVNFAMKIFKKEVLEKFSLNSDGSFFIAEFLLKSHYKQCKIVNIPVDFNHRKYGKSQLGTFDNIFKIICELIRCYPEIKSFQSRVQLN